MKKNRRKKQKKTNDIATSIIHDIIFSGYGM